MRKRTPVRTRKRTRARRSAVSAVIVAVLGVLLFQTLSGPSAQAVSNTDCPGGSSSGSSTSTTCANLHNDDLLSQRSFPAGLWRGDSRLPYDIFRQGFTSRGANDDLVQHVQGDRAGNSNYISTTDALGVAEPFARSQGLRNLQTAARTPHCSSIRRAFYATIPGLGPYLLSSCIDGDVTADTYVYDIDPRWARNAVYVPDQIRGNADLYNHYASQREWAYVHEIPNYAVRGVRVYQMTARVNAQGLIDTRTITFRYRQYLINPNHIQPRVLYNPETDEHSNFDYESNLHIPAVAANSYDRGCNANDRCRGGGN
ncbi:hypothetical protein [Streptomyces sp. SID13726]|uniref:hypothetical protein n=1 Tax=Streptomyces sp. SID13726 TaxID=2706058 RepID=UPI0013B96036|nr:hypothetical protein [Streptomyces sp. SID13726]NEB03467.1 hypothetical protein [Streptomyces sp. SID13726]